MTAKELKQSLSNVPDDAQVVFQGNEPGEEDGPDDDPGSVVVIGTVFSAWFRQGNRANPGDEFVIDGAIESSNF